MQRAELYKGTKQNESKGYTSGKSGGGCILTWCMVHLPASVLEYILTEVMSIGFGIIVV